MKPLICLFALASLVAPPAIASEEAPATVAAAPAIPDDILALEKELQSLNWPQFRAVVSAIPKLKAEVDAYGPLGWQYVRGNYQRYAWRKSIRKLSEAQKGDLTDLIAQARRNPALANEAAR